MKRIKVVAVKPHLYAGVNRTIGETYEAEEKYLKLLVTMGVVRVAESPEEPGRYRRRDMRVQK